MFPSRKPYVEDLVTGVTVFGDSFPKEVIKVKTSSKG